MATLAENYKSQLEGPMVAGDIKSIKLNIAKLVKLQGGTPETKASSFFSASKAQENEYESKFLSKSKSPTQMGKSSSGGSGGGFFDSIGSFFKLLLTGGLIAGAIAAIGKMLENPETRETIRKFLVDAFESIFNGVRSIIEFAGSALSDPKVIDSIIGVFQELGKQLINIIIGIDKSLTESFNIPGGLLTVLGVGGLLYVALTSAIAAVGAFVTAANLAAARLSGGVFGGGGPRTKPGTKPGTVPGTAPGTKPGGGKFGSILKGTVLAGAGLIGYRALENVGGDSNQDGGAMDILKQTGQAAGMIAATAGAYKVAGIAKDKLNSITAEKLATGGKYKMAPGSMAPGGSGYNPNGKNMPLEKVLERMKTFADKAYKKGWTNRIFARVTRTLGIGVALRLSGFFAGLVAAPFSAGISALISIALAAWTVYDLYLLYDLLFGSGNLEKELEDEDAAASNAKSPTIESDKSKTSIAITPTRPVSDEQKRLGMMHKAAIASGNAASSSTAPTQANGSSNLLDIIAGGESGRMGYDAANKGKAGDTPGGMPGLSNMKVGDVMRLQQEKKLFAAGRYQIIPTTLAGLISGKYGNTGVSLNDTFDAATQDKLVTALINKRLQQGGDDPIKQQYALSQEFASIANPYTNSSYYDKVGNNKASIGTSTIQAALTGSPSATMLASNRSSSGETLASASNAVAEQRMAMASGSSGGAPIVNAPVTNNTVNNSGGRSGGIISAFNDDMMKYLLIRTA